MGHWVAGLAALLVFAAPGAAAAATGYVGALYSNVDVEHEDASDAWGVQGAVAFEGSSDISFEVDAGSSNAADTISRLAAHVLVRDESSLVGGFAAVDRSNNDTAWSVGLEANKYFDRWTLASAVAYKDDDDIDASGWGATAQARFFPADNVRLDVHAGYARVDYGGLGQSDVTAAGAGAEYQFEAAPISIAAAYDHADLDHGQSASAWMVTVRYNWGGTLRDRDRTGASQADMVSLAGIL
jgi:hypothetical protein